MKRVYFAGSIRGGREDLALYPSGWAAEVEQAARRGITMQTLRNIFFVTLAVQLRQPPQHFETCGFRDGEADAVVLWHIRHFVEAMLEIEIVPAVSSNDCVI